MPLIIWFVLVVFFSSICFAVHESLGRLKRLHQIPCSRCAFFTDDYRLKCTVHPCSACSEDALHCIDFEPLPHRYPTPLRPTQWGSWRGWKLMRRFSHPQQH